MIDVGEVQVALNVWGTLHATGYPLYSLMGNVSTTLLRAIGVNAATAPSLYSLGWGLLALSMFYLLIARLTTRPEIAVLATLILGLARSVWVYNVVAKEYSMNLAVEVALLAIAVWPPGITAQNVRKRALWLALIGGLGVAHHRTVILMVPGLLWAAWPSLRQQGKRVWLILSVALLIGLGGFLPYLYLPLRAQAHGVWVYGEPGTWPGFWDQFLGREAAYIMHPPVDVQAWVGDLLDTAHILIVEVSLWLLLVGTLLCWLTRKRLASRKELQVALLSSIGYVLFLLFFHRVVLPEAVAIPVVMLLVFVTALALDKLLSTGAGQFWKVGYVLAAIGIVLILNSAQHDFIYQLTHDNTGVDIIALARQVPAQSVLMLPWGPRFHAVAFSKYVTGENASLHLVDHNANFAELMSEYGVLYTASDTFFGPPFNGQPLDWWDQRIGHAYLSSPTDGLISIRNTPRTTLSSQVGTVVGYGIQLYSRNLCVEQNTIQLTLTWQAAQRPDTNLSVFVHLLGAGSPVPLQTADSAQPVYGWYPTSRWTADELVEEHYRLAVAPGATAVEFGMYTAAPQGRFTNYGTQRMPLPSDGACTGE